MMVLPVQAVQFSRNLSEMEHSLRKKSLKDNGFEHRLENSLIEQRATPLKKGSAAKLNRQITRSEAKLDI